MSHEWHGLCAEPGFDVDEDRIDVELGDGRSHRVRVASTSGTWELTAVVASPSVLNGLDAASIVCWTRNRLSDLVGFRIDGRGRLLANSWIPKAGITSGEFRMQVRLLAREADQFEFALTGADTH